MFLERGTHRSISQGRELLAKEDAVPSLETLRTCSGGQLHGSVGRGFNTNAA